MMIKCIHPVRKWKANAELTFKSCCLFWEIQVCLKHSYEMAAFPSTLVDFSNPQLPARQRWCENRRDDEKQAVYSQRPATTRRISQQGGVGVVSSLLPVCRGRRTGAGLALMYPVRRTRARAHLGQTPATHIPPPHASRVPSVRQHTYKTLQSKRRLCLPSNHKTDPIQTNDIQIKDPM